MSKQPTNGPYHWGNGPKPTRKAGNRKVSTHGCFAMVLISKILTFLKQRSGR